MFSLCRLCAKCTEPAELTIEITELESRLVLCCGWQPSTNEFQMPKKACNSCVSEVQRSWDLVERIQEAETKLNKFLNEQLPIDTNQHGIEFKVECEAEPTNYTADTKFDEDEDYYDDGAGAGDAFDSDNDNGNHDVGDVFGESIHYFNDEDSKPKIDDKQSPTVEKKSKNKNQMKMDPFFATLSPEDFYGYGQISSNGITKLTKLYPDMKTMSWDECQYKCIKCDRIVKGSNNLYAHMRSIHMDESKSIKISCCYCNFKDRREQNLHRHMMTEHFKHLKFR